jgi:hypothetical protein
MVRQILRASSTDDGEGVLFGTTLDQVELTRQLQKRRSDSTFRSHPLL